MSQSLTATILISDYILQKGSGYFGTGKIANLLFSRLWFKYLNIIRAPAIEWICYFSGSYEEWNLMFTFEKESTQALVSEQKSYLPLYNIYL